MKPQTNVCLWCYTIERLSRNIKFVTREFGSTLEYENTLLSGFFAKVFETCLAFLFANFQAHFGLTSLSSDFEVVLWELEPCNSLIANASPIL